MKSLQAIILISACAFGLPSCLLAVGGAAGYAFGQELVVTETPTSIELVDVETVWASAQQSMENRADPGGIEVTSYPRRIECEFSGATVEIDVEAYDLNRTLIRVKASRFMSSDGNVARMVLNYIIDDLGQPR
jgi:hypothetical protein